MFNECLEAATDVVENMDNSKKLISKVVQKCEFLSFISKKHNVTTEMVKKISLCAYEGKNFWLDTINSVPHGHYLATSTRKTK